MNIVDNNNQCVFLRFYHYVYNYWDIVLILITLFERKYFFIESVISDENYFEIKTLRNR